MKIWLLMLPLALISGTALLMRSCVVGRQSGKEEAASLAVPSKEAAGAESQSEFLVTDEVVTADVRRIGVNLGSWTSWGAEALCSNVIKNPGFEGIIDRTLVVVTQAAGDRFVDDVEWVGRPDDFWAGATFDVRTGAAAGKRGTIVSSRKTGASGLPEYTTSHAVRRLEPGDIVSLTRQTDAELPTQWWVPQQSNGLVTVAMRPRPDSPGVRSISLNPASDRDAELVSYLDAIGDRAGKLLPVAGRWRLSFWNCSPNGKSNLSAEFSRKGSPPFVSSTITSKRKWRKTTIEFSATDSGPEAILELHFKVSGGASGVLLDDVELGPVQPEPQAFRDEVVRTLEMLHPGYIRDWQGQLGDTLANRLAPAFARRASRYRPGDETDFLYSIPEFLDLCKRVKANPWIVMPTTMGDDEAFELGQYLSSRAAEDGFDEILVEFGNENWNGTFRPAGIADPRVCGEAAERAFAKLRQGAGSQVRLLTVVNGQHANPDYALKFASGAPSADLLAVAPYFAFILDASTSTSEAFSSLFSGDGDRLQQEARAAGGIGKEIALYELNLHTTEGNASAEARDKLTAGAASASAVARTILEGMTVGARRQCVYSLAGYDSWLGDRSGFVKLWGVVRDLSVAGRMRPSGLAVSILNRAIAGDLMRVARPAGNDDASVYAFRSPTGWSAAVVSWSPQPRNITIAFPSDTAAPRRLLTLVALSPESTNEGGELVRITEETLAQSGTSIEVRVPAYGLCALVRE